MYPEEIGFHTAWVPNSYDGQPCAPSSWFPACTPKYWVVRSNNSPCYSSLLTAPQWPATSTNSQHTWTAISSSHGNHTCHQCSFSTWTAIGKHAASNDSSSSSSQHTSQHTWTTSTNDTSSSSHNNHTCHQCSSQRTWTCTGKHAATNVSWNSSPLKHTSQHTWTTSTDDTLSSSHSNRTCHQCSFSTWTAIGKHASSNDSSSSSSQHTSQHTWTTSTDDTSSSSHNNHTCHQCSSQRTRTCTGKHAATNVSWNSSPLKHTSQHTWTTSTDDTSSSSHNNHTCHQCSFSTWTAIGKHAATNVSWNSSPLKHTSQHTWTTPTDDTLSSSHGNHTCHQCSFSTWTAIGKHAASNDSSSSSSQHTSQHTWTTSTDETSSSGHTNVACPDDPWCRDTATTPW